jgi:putative two-component system response regulator
MEKGILKILSVDDDAINTKLLLKMLSRYPDIENIETVKIAVNGQEAIDEIKADKEINLILLDIQMPVMTGMEFLEIRMTDEDLANIPVVVLTTDETKKVEALDKGATDFLTKPIREKELFEKLDMIKELYE